MEPWPISSDPVFNYFFTLIVQPSLIIVMFHAALSLLSGRS